MNPLSDRLTALERLMGAETDKHPHFGFDGYPGLQIRDESGTVRTFPEIRPPLTDEERAFVRHLTPMNKYYEHDRFELRRSDLRRLCEIADPALGKGE